jgi:hypothetical protein
MLSDWGNGGDKYCSPLLQYPPHFNMITSRTIRTHHLNHFLKPYHCNNILRTNTISRFATMSTISEAIIKDHRELEQYYNEVVNSSDHDHQARFGNQFTWELARHSIGEELVVYPAFEKYLGKEGKEKADKDREEHHKVRTPSPSIGNHVRYGHVLTGINPGQRIAQRFPKHELPRFPIRPQAQGTHVGLV